MGTITKGEITAEDEVEVLVKAFDDVRKLFEGREWLMQGRGNYPYDDDGYKLEVKYMMDEFDEIKRNTWANIKTISSDYRRKIIAEYTAEQEKAFKRMTILAEAVSPVTKWKTLASERTCAMIINCPVGAGVIFTLLKFLKQGGYKYNWIQASKYLPIANIIYEIGKEKFDYVLLDEFDKVSLDMQEKVLEYIKNSDHNRRIIISAHHAGLLKPELLQSCYYLDLR